MFAFSLTVDLIVFVSCTAACVAWGKLRHSHPATIYIFFHFYTFTWRLIGLAGGATVLFLDWGPLFDAVEPAEIQRAAMFGDIALVGFSAATILAARRSANVVSPPTEARLLSTRLVLVVGLLAFIPGLWGMTLFQPGSSGEVSGAFDPLAAARESSYVQILPGWPTLVLLILIYVYGFRTWLIIPLLACLGFMSLQGYHRFRVIIPSLMLLQIYLDRRGRRWPTPIMLVGVVFLAALFFPLKQIGRLAQHGASAADIASTTALVAGDALVGKADDQTFLDQYASCLTLVDARGQLYWGKPYAALVTLPIPRQVWSEKPTPADHIREISTPRRPMFEAGMIITYLGEAYANFSWVGIVLVPPLLAYALARFHHSAYNSNYLSILRFSHMMIGVNLIQVYRDGLVSIVVFTAVNMMPLTILMFLHRVGVGPSRVPATVGTSPA